MRLRRQDGKAILPCRTRDLLRQQWALWIAILDQAAHRLVLVRLAHLITAAPHGLDVVLAVRGVIELLANLADKNVNDLDLRLVHPAVKIVEEHLLRKRRTLA